MATFRPPVAFTRPPTVPDPHPGNVLMRHYGGQPVGQTVFKSGGVWVTKQYPSQSELDAATVVYLGGHEYPLSASEEADLIAGGFSAYIS